MDNTATVLCCKEPEIISKMTGAELLDMLADAVSRRIGSAEETLYMSVDEAAAWARIGQNTMREYLNSADPPPHILVGKNTRLIQRAALPAYLESKQEVVLK